MSKAAELLQARVISHSDRTTHTNAMVKKDPLTLHQGTLRYFIIILLIANLRFMRFRAYVEILIIHVIPVLPYHGKLWDDYTESHYPVQWGRLIVSIYLWLDTGCTVLLSNSLFISGSIPSTNSQLPSLHAVFSFIFSHNPDPQDSLAPIFLGRRSCLPVQTKLSTTVY